MVDPVTMEVAAKALEKPKEVGEGVREVGVGVEHAADGLGRGLKDVGAGVANIEVGAGEGAQHAAVGISVIVEKSKTGTAAIEKEKGIAKANQTKAQGDAEAQRIHELGVLAEKIKDLPPEMQEKILAQVAPAKPAEPEAPQQSPVLKAAQALAGPSIMLRITTGLVRAAAKPGTSITDQQNQGACSLAPEQGLTFKG